MTRQHQFYLNIIIKNTKPIAVYGQERKTLYSDYDFIIITNNKKSFPHWSGIDYIMSDWKHFKKSPFANYRKDWTLLFGKDIWKPKKYNNKKLKFRTYKFYARITSENYKRIALLCIHRFNKFKRRLYDSEGEVLDTPNLLKFNYKTLTKEQVEQIYRQTMDLMDEYEEKYEKKNNCNNHN